jgi:hypothetical protein
VGSTEPQRCSDGTYSNSTGAAACTPCPAGFYCSVQATSPVVCPAGRYCPGATGASQPLCTNGTFSAATGLSAASACSACSGGSYCDSMGLTAPSGAPRLLTVCASVSVSNRSAGFCSAGYYCTSGAILATGSGGIGGVCPAGHYCPINSSAPTACPAGTYNGATGTSVKLEAATLLTLFNRR